MVPLVRELSKGLEEKFKVDFLMDFKRKVLKARESGSPRLARPLQFHLRSSWALWQ